MRPLIIMKNKNILRNISFVGFLILTILISSCKSTHTNQGQGVSGQVLWVEGNQMPPQNESKLTGVKKTLYVYELTNLSQVEGQPPLFDMVKTQLLITIKTDSRGRFKQQLEPGSYSIFVKEKTKFFANQFNTQGLIQSFEIKSGQWHTLTIKINYAASY